MSQIEFDPDDALTFRPCSATSLIERTVVDWTGSLLFGFVLFQLLRHVSVLSRFGCCRFFCDFSFCDFCIALLTGKHPGQSSASRAVPALKWEAEEDGPDEGTAAGECGPQVERHQGKVQKLEETEFICYCLNNKQQRLVPLNCNQALKLIEMWYNSEENLLSKIHLIAAHQAGEMWTIKRKHHMFSNCFLWFYFLEIHVYEWL